MAIEIRHTISVSYGQSTDGVPAPHWHGALLGSLIQIQPFSRSVEDPVSYAIPEHSLPVQHVLTSAAAALATAEACGPVPSG